MPVVKVVSKPEERSPYLSEMAPGQVAETADGKFVMRTSKGFVFLDDVHASVSSETTLKRILPKGTVLEITL